MANTQLWKKVSAHASADAATFAQASAEAYVGKAAVKAGIGIEPV